MQPQKRVNAGRSELRVETTYAGVDFESMEQRGFHRVLVAFNLPARWPLPAVLAGIVLAAGVVGALWAAAAGLIWGTAAGAVLALASVADLAILESLPRRRLSFGLVQPQLVILAVPRLAVGAAGALLALLAGPLAALVVVVIAQVAGVALLWWGTRSTGAIGLTELPLPAPALAAGRSLRVLQISDIHVERAGRREEALLDLVERTAPDLVLLTGDYVNLSCVEDPVARLAARSVLARLRAPAGVFAILGSPLVDRNSGPIFENLPAVRLLRDEVVTLDTKAGRVALIGLELTHDEAADARRLRRLLADVPGDAYRILLYHTPDLMPHASQHSIDLFLAGHTHGGQIRLPLYGAFVTSSRLGKRYEMGHYFENGTHLYVSRGIGLEGMGAPRLRFLAPPEVTLFTLQGRRD